RRRMHLHVPRWGPCIPTAPRPPLRRGEGERERRRLSVFRWPVRFTPLSLGGAGRPREATLEVTPRGALFTLVALSHVGHPAHLALIDAYLKGQMRVTPSAGIGEDSRLVASALAA